MENTRYVVDILHRPHTCGTNLQKIISSMKMDF